MKWAALISFYHTFSHHVHMILGHVLKENYLY